MDLQCPVCEGSVLQPVSVRKDTIYKCPQCEGFWFDREGLSGVEDLPESELMGTFQSQLNGAGVQTQDTGRGRSCPRCGEPLDNHQYDVSSGIWVDSCPAGEGVWLDRGEVMAIHKHLSDAMNAMSPAEVEALQAQLEKIKVEERAKEEAAIMAPLHHQGKGAMVPVWHAMDGVCRVAYHLLYKLGL